MMGLRIDRMLWRARCKHVCKQAFIPAGGFSIHHPAVPGTPVPVEMDSAIPRLPSPLCFPPKPINATTKVSFSGTILAEILAGAEKPLEQERAFHYVTAIVFATEGHGRAGPPVDQMRE